MNAPTPSGTFTVVPDPTPDLTHCPCCGQLRPATLLMEAIVAVTEDRFSATLKDLRSPFRQDRLVTARALATWALRSFGPGQSYTSIGRMLGRRDHTTIIALHKKAIRLRLEDAAFEAACQDVAARLIARSKKEV